jgi:hypothetical protein
VEPVPVEPPQPAPPGRGHVSAAAAR